MRCREGTHPLQSMTKGRNKKKEQGKGKEQKEGEGISLKVANEYRRTNQMEPLPKEQHEARKAVIWANNKKAEEAVRRMRDQTNSDQTLSNTHEPQQTKANNPAALILLHFAG